MDDQYEGLSKKERRERAKQEKLDLQKRGARNRMVRRLVLWTLVLLGIGVLVFALFRIATSKPADSAVLSAQQDVLTDDWTKGNPDASVMLVEYSDFQCPACRQYEPIVAKLNAEFGDQILFVYRHFPLRQIHPNAASAARAAEAAGRQGKFWEMHDQLFAAQEDWSDLRDPRETFVSYAEALKLHTEQFRADFDDSATRDKVTRDERAGLRARVNATPTFFLNDEKLKTPPNYDAFRSIIQAAIDANS